MQLIEMFDRGVELNPDGVCLEMNDGSCTLTYTEVAALSHRVAASLADAGVGSETKVGVLSPNDPIAYCCVLGALRLNATWVPLNTRSTVPDLVHVLDLADCEFLFYHASLTQLAGRLADEVRALRGLVSIGPGRDGDPELDAWMAPEGTTVALPPDTPDTVAVMFSSGGTTGRSKAVMLTHRVMELMCLAFEVHMPEPTPPVQLMAAPMTHAAGPISFPVFMRGGTTIVHGGVVPAEMLESIERHRVTRMFLPPTAIYALLAHPGVREHDYSSLRHFIYAAAPMSVDKLKEAMEVFGPVMTQTFGQAEAPMICTFFGPEEHVRALAEDPDRLGSCGRSSAVAHVEIMGEDGSILPPGEKGEIVVRGAMIMAGYYKDPDETAAATKHGWHATGDIGYKDEQGYVYIVDRLRDMIITGGFNVYPGQIEQVIWSHPQVRDCAVIGVPDEKWGELVTAVVEVKDGAEIDPDEIVALCRDRLGPVKTPKSVIFRELPRSAVGKVLKRRLRDEYWTAQARAV